MERRISSWCTQFGYEIVPAEQSGDAALWAAETKVFRVKDMFTTLDGLWDQSKAGQPGCIPEWAMEYATPEFTERGGATHLFSCVLKPDGTLSKQTQLGYWSDGYDKLATWDGKSQPTWLTITPTAPASGWANVFLEHSSGFNWQGGVKGWWCVTKMPGLSDVVRYLGLPGSAHISTFVVFQEMARGAVDPGDPGNPPTDGTLRADLVAALANIQAALGRLDSIKAQFE